jgi:ATP-dependent 26S proteasome regulatory subunit
MAGADVDLEKIAHDFELSPGSMINVIRYCALAAVRRGDQVAHHADILAGIRREMAKEARLL